MGSEMCIRDRYWGHGMPVYWVPLAFRSLAMGTYGLSYEECAHCPRCPLLARRARWLAGRARASSQFQNSGSCMHDLLYLCGFVDDDDEDAVWGSGRISPSAARGVSSHAARRSQGSTVSHTHTHATHTHLWRAWRTRCHQKHNLAPLPDPAHAVGAPPHQAACKHHNTEKTKI